MGGSRNSTTILAKKLANLTYPQKRGLTLPTKSLYLTKEKNCSQPSHTEGNTCHNIHLKSEKKIKAILKAAQESITRGARKDYLPYWTEKIQKLNDEVTLARELVEENPTIENNIFLKPKKAKLKKRNLVCNDIQLE